MVEPTRLRLIALLILLAPFACTIGCDDQSSAIHSEASPGSAGSSVEHSAFPPSLLLSDGYTQKYSLKIPPAQGEEWPPLVVRLADGKPGILSCRMVVECADEATVAELRKEIEPTMITIKDLLSGEDPTSVRSAAGKLRLKEEIVQVLKDQLQNKGIKQVYLQDFAVGLR